MTGEVTLRGKVLEIGGVKEKMLAAYRAGLREVIMPKSNEKDLRDVPDEVRANMAFTFVIDDGRGVALGVVAAGGGRPGGSAIGPAGRARSGGTDGGGGAARRGRSRA